MIQEFFIRKGSTLPVLRMELIDDGKYDFGRNHEVNCALQDADVTFSMENAETGEIIISRKPASIVLSAESGCTDKVVIEYKWDERDTRKPGAYKGTFVIDFHGNIKEEGVVFPKGKLIMPMHEELMIYIS